MRRGLVFADQFLGILNEADEDNDGGSDQAQEKHRFEEFHDESRDGEHASILAPMAGPRYKDGIRGRLRVRFGV